MRRPHHIFCLLIVLLLTACAPQKPLTAEQRTMLDDQQQCSQAATDMNDAPHNSSNPFWDSYFTMCMTTQKGYTRAQIRQLWY